MTDSLFDAEPYGHSSRTERTKKPPVAPEVIAIQASEIWRLTSKLTPGVVHAHQHGITEIGNKHIACPTFCGKAGVPQTFRPSETVMGCRACIRAGARFLHPDER